jgi:hypothetical protein
VYCNTTVLRNSQDVNGSPVLVVENPGFGNGELEILTLTSIWADSLVLVLTVSTGEPTLLYLLFGEIEIQSNQGFPPGLNGYSGEAGTWVIPNPFQ